MSDHAHVGSKIVPRFDLKFRGGMFTTKSVICPNTTASKCSAIQSMCQFESSCVDGSVIENACGMYSRYVRRGAWSPFAIP